MTHVVNYLSQTYIAFILTLCAGIAILRLKWYCDISLITITIQSFLSYKLAPASILNLRCYEDTSSINIKYLHTTIKIRDTVFPWKNRKFAIHKP